MSQDRIELVQGQTGIELPLAAGNWVMLREEGYSPVQSLVAAVGACGAYVYQSVLEKSRIPFTFERATADYSRDVEKATEPVKSISLTFYVSVAPELQERAERALKLVSKNCPVIQSLNPAIEVVEHVVFQ